MNRWFFQRSTIDNKIDHFSSTSINHTFGHESHHSYNQMYLRNDYTAEANSSSILWSFISTGSSFNRNRSIAFIQSQSVTELYGISILLTNVIIIATMPRHPLIAFRWIFDRFINDLLSLGHEGSPGSASSVLGRGEEIAWLRGFFWWVISGQEIRDNRDSPITSPALLLPPPPLSWCSYTVRDWVIPGGIRDTRGAVVGPLALLDKRNAVCFPKCFEKPCRSHYPSILFASLLIWLCRVFNDRPEIASRMKYLALLLLVGAAALLEAKEQVIILEYFRMFRLIFDL